MMTLSPFDSSLPDPEHQGEFYADVPSKRFFAWLADGVAILLLSLLTLPFTLFMGLFFFPLILFCVGLVYRTVTLANRSATPGMRLTSIEIRGHDGGYLDLPTAFLHTLGYYGSLTVFPLQLISVVLMLTTDRRQGLSDHVLGTAAINRPSAG